MVKVSRKNSQYSRICTEYVAQTTCLDKLPDCNKRRYASSTGLLQ